MTINFRTGAAWFLAVMILTAGLATSSSIRAADAGKFGDDYVPTVLITGSNRGIGLEFTRQYAERGWNVIATARNPETAAELNELAGKHDRIVVEQLDVTDFGRVDELAEIYADTPISAAVRTPRSS